MVILSSRIGLRCAQDRFVLQIQVATQGDLQSSQNFVGHTREREDLGCLSIQFPPYVILTYLRTIKLCLQHVENDFELINLGAFLLVRLPVLSRLPLGDQILDGIYCDVEEVSECFLNKSSLSDKNEGEERRIRNSYKIVHSVGPGRASSMASPPARRSKNWNPGE